MNCGSKDVCQRVAFVLLTIVTGKCERKLLLLEAKIYANIRNFNDGFEPKEPNIDFKFEGVYLQAFLVR